MEGHPSVVVFDPNAPQVPWTMENTLLLKKVDPLPGTTEDKAAAFFPTRSVKAVKNKMAALRKEQSAVVVNSGDGLTEGGGEGGKGVEGKKARKFWGAQENGDLFRNRFDTEPIKLKDRTSRQCHDQLKKLKEQHPEAGELVREGLELADVGALDWKGEGEAKLATRQTRAKDQMEDELRKLGLLSAAWEMEDEDDDLYSEAGDDGLEIEFDEDKDDDDDEDDDDDDENDDDDEESAGAGDERANA